MPVETLLSQNRFSRAAYTTHTATPAPTRWARWREYALSVIERPLYWLEGVLTWEPQAYRDDFARVPAA